MRNDTRHLRDGFVLPATLLALIVIGAIVTGGFYVSAAEDQISVSSDLGVQAQDVAEYGLQDVLGTWKNQDIIAAASNATPTPGEAWSDNRLLGTYEVSIRSLGGRLFLIRVAGTATRGPRTTTRVVGGLGRTTSAGLPYEGAMSILGPLSVEGQADIVGTDQCDATNVVPGVNHPVGGSVTESGNGDVQGSPETNPEATLSQTTLSQFGDVSLADMIATADIVYPDGANPTNTAPETTTDADGNTICDTSIDSNWGDLTAAAPCSDWYPIIYGEGDLAINGSGSGAAGQGILIVEGDMTIDGNVVFHGVVIVMGDLYYAGQGGHVEGSMIVMGSTPSTNAGNSELAYNSCAVENAFNGSLRSRPLESRSWVDLSAAVRPLPAT